MPDYATLRFIWWLILGALLIGFAIMDGFDFGLAATFRSLGRTDEERRALLESVEPVWEGNQVWFILAGGAVFAAWPLLYAAAFSGLYLAMFVLLVALILRPVGFVFRNKVPDPRWRNVWDWVLTIAGIVPALLFGVAFGNLFLGVPFHFDALATPGLHRQLRVPAAPLRAARRRGEPGDDRDARQRVRGNESRAADVAAREHVRARGGARVPRRLQRGGGLGGRPGRPSDRRGCQSAR